MQIIKLEGSVEDIRPFLGGWAVNVDRFEKKGGHPAFIRNGEMRHLPTGYIRSWYDGKSVVYHSSHINNAKGKVTFLNDYGEFVQNISEAAMVCRPHPDYYCLNLNFIPNAKFIDGRSHIEDRYHNRENLINFALMAAYGLAGENGLVFVHIPTRHTTAMSFDKQYKNLIASCDGLTWIGYCNGKWEKDCTSEIIILDNPLL